MFCDFVAQPLTDVNFEGMWFGNRGLHWQRLVTITAKYRE